MDYQSHQLTLLVLAAKSAVVAVVANYSFVAVVVAGVEQTAFGGTHLVDVGIADEDETVLVGEMYAHHSLLLLLPLPPLVAWCVAVVVVAAEYKIVADIVVTLPVVLPLLLVDGIVGKHRTDIAVLLALVVAAAV